MYTFIFIGIAFCRLLSFGGATPFSAPQLPQLQGRDHLECGDDGYNCHIVLTCGNDFNSLPGVAPAPPPSPSSSSRSSSSSSSTASSTVLAATASALASSAAICGSQAGVAAINGQNIQAVEYDINGTMVIVNGTLIGGTIVNSTLTNGTIVNGTSPNANGTVTYINSTMINGTIISINGNNTSTPLTCKQAPVHMLRRDLAPRQTQGLIHWCALGTALFVDINPTNNKQYASNIKTLINGVISTINSPGNDPNAVISSTSGLQSSAFSNFDKGANRVDAYNVANLTWKQFGTAMGLIKDWMAGSKDVKGAGYQWVSVSIYNGQTVIGRVIIN